MESISTIISDVRSFMSETGIRPSRLAVMAGLSVNALRGIDAPNWNPRAATLTALEKVVFDHQSTTTGGAA